MAKDPQTVLAKYQRGIQNGSQAYKDGVNAPKRSWAQGYTANVDRMVQGLQAAIAAGTPQRAVQSMGDAGWKEKTLAKSDRYAASATSAANSYAQVVAKVMSAANAGQQAALAIPATTWSQRLDRVRANAEAIARTWGKELR